MGFSNSKISNIFFAFTATAVILVSSIITINYLYQSYFQNEERIRVLLEQTSSDKSTALREYFSAIKSEIQLLRQSILVLAAYSELERGFIELK